MRIITSLALLALLGPTHAMEGMANRDTEKQQLMDKLLDKMVDKFFTQALKVLQLQHTDLDDTALGIGSFDSLLRTLPASARGPLGRMSLLGNRVAPIHAVSPGSSGATPMYPADSSEFPPALLRRRELASLAAVVSGAAALEAKADEAAPAPAPAPPPPPPAPTPPPTLNKACDASSKICVSSETKGTKVAPFQLLGSQQESFEKLKKAIKELPRSRIDSSTPDSISATIPRQVQILAKTVNLGDGAGPLWHVFYVKFNAKYDPSKNVIQVQAESTDPSVKKFADDTKTSAGVLEDIRGFYSGFPKAVAKSPRLAGKVIPGLEGWTGWDWGALQALQKSGFKSNSP